MPKPLSDATQRLFFGVLVVVLVAFGIYWSLGGFSGLWSGGSDGASGGSAGKQEGAPSPSPIPTTDTKDMDVLDWLPIAEDDLKSAGATAQGFAAAYGTIDYAKSQDSYYSSLEAFASKDYAKTLSRSSGAEAMWGENAKEKKTSEGHAEITAIRSFDEKSVVFVVQAQSITKGSDGATEDLGRFAVTVVEEGGDWRVYDFQPADAANLGDG